MASSFALRVVQKISDSWSYRAANCRHRDDGGGTAAAFPSPAGIRY
jgi:hypothetical protein